MAERRMFAKTIIDSDAFLDMPLSSQCLYFHLSMRADDEGFINNPKKIQRMVGASEDDTKLLLAKNFIIAFDSGVVVIKHWRIHNYIRADRLVETKYQEERNMLTVKDNGAYTFNKYVSVKTIEAVEEAEIKSLEDLDAKDKRKIAYQNSSLPYSFTYKIRRAFDGKKCPVCGKTMNASYKTSCPTVQHNLPISKGGLHELENISVICESCNTSIRDKETSELNNTDVIETWDKIVTAEKNGIDWFMDVNTLNSVGQMSVTCQSNDSIGKDSIGKSKDSKDKDIYCPVRKQVIAYLNEKTSSKYRDSKSTKRLIDARLKEGYTLEDFQTVIDKKCKQWLMDSQMAQYLRPETLFNATHFESYLNEVDPWKKAEEMYGTK